MAAIPTSTSSSHASRPSSPSSVVSSSTSTLPFAYPTLPGIDASSVEIRRYIICYLRKVYSYSPAEAENEAEKFRGDGIAFYRLDELDLKNLFGVAGQLMWDGIQRSDFGLFSIPMYGAIRTSLAAWRRRRRGLVEQQPRASTVIEQPCRSQSEPDSVLMSSRSSHTGSVSRNVNSKVDYGSALRRDVEGLRQRSGVRIRNREEAEER